MKNTLKNSVVLTLGLSLLTSTTTFASNNQEWGEELSNEGRVSQTTEEKTPTKEIVISKPKEKVYLLGKNTKDITLTIIEFVDDKTLAKLCQVNKTFYHLIKSRKGARILQEIPLFHNHTCPIMGLKKYGLTYGVSKWFKSYLKYYSDEISQTEERKKAHKYICELSYEAFCQFVGSYDPPCLRLPQHTPLDVIEVCSYDEYDFLPPSIASLSDLSSMTFSSESKGKLNKLPEAWGHLTNLKRLDLSDHNLNDLPESYKNLTNLTVLDLGDNNLSAVPKVVSYFTNLKELRLGYNKLEGVPDFIGDLKKLRVLGLDNNLLKEIPEWIYELDELENLHLDKNFISERTIKLKKGEAIIYYPRKEK